MDPDERVTALKKAYAEIILNTAKEAAARIMVSERKAQRFENELKVAKEEALRMLLRLKQMMDAKISEAELTSLSQQKKIEELEAQLQEAEDIVRDLREELREVQSELERVTNDKVQHLNNPDIATQGKISEVNRPYTSRFVEFQPPQWQAESIVACAMKHASQNYRNTAHGCYCTSIYMGNSYGGSPDLPSIILRSKGPELYRNGCTQRIRACDRNLMDQESSLSGQIKIEGEKSVREDEGGKVIRKAHSHEDKNKSNFEKKVVQAGSSLPNWSFIKKRKRATRYRKNRTPLSRNVFCQSVKTVQAPEISLLRTHPTGDGAPPGESSSEISPRLLSDKGEPGLQSGCAGTAENEAKFVESCTDQSTKNTDKVLTAKTALQNMGCKESSEIPVSQTSLEKIGPQSMKLESEASDTSNSLPSRTINDKMFLYTFQRKRKRESSIRPDENESSRNNASEENASVGKNTSIEIASLDKNTPHEKASLEKSTSDENTSLRNNTSMRKVAEEHNGSIDTKTFFVTESSRDNRQLVQVARQLISLSEKKWWQ